MTTQQFPPWPPAAPFAASKTDSQGQGTPDFPQSSGDRERGKFRPSVTPGLTQVAVVNEDGTQIGTALVPSFEEIAIYQKAMLLALAKLADIPVADLLAFAAEDND